MKLYSLNEITSLAERFENLTLPKTEWTHDAHLTVAAWYLLNSPAEQAIEMIRQNIKTYNESVGGKNTDTSGYHETITLFYMLEIDAFFNSCSVEDKFDAMTSFFKSSIAAKNYPFQFYSTERLSSKEARLNWTEPDLKPLTRNKILV